MAWLCVSCVAGAQSGCSTCAGGGERQREHKPPPQLPELSGRLRFSCYLKATRVPQSTAAASTSVNFSRYRDRRRLVLVGTGSKAWDSLVLVPASSFTLSWFNPDRAWLCASSAAHPAPKRLLSKGPLYPTELVQTKVGVRVSRQLRIDTVSDVLSSFLHRHIHPSSRIH